MTWTITDRATRVVFYGCLALAGAVLVPVFLDRGSIITMALVLMLVYQSWRLAVGRQVQVEVTAEGITKSVGNDRYSFTWDQVSAARWQQFLGSRQLVLELATAQAWNASNRLLGRLNRTEFAIQVPDSRVEAVTGRLASQGVVLR